jgi:hypothetical protein
MLTKQQLLKDRRKTNKQTLPTGQPPGKTKIELVLKYQHQDRILEE